jgi:hypothetical protein
MRYLVLKPHGDRPIDPRDLKIRDAAHLHELLPPIADVVKEHEAVVAVRKLYPNALAMPFVCGLGSGHVLLVGVLPDPSPIDPDDTIPFVMFVQPVPMHAKDKDAIAAMMKGRSPTGVFDEKVWRLQPVVPNFGSTTPIEWRTSELRVPAFLDAKIGYDDSGRLVIYAEMGDHKLSITLRDTNYRFVEEPKPPTLIPLAKTSDSTPIVGG